MILGKSIHPPQGFRGIIGVLYAKVVDEFSGYASRPIKPRTHGIQKPVQYRTKALEGYV